MPEEEDFQKIILDALAKLKQQIEELETAILGISQVFQRQAELKGSECSRVAENYCTAWELRSVPEEAKREFIYIGGRYHRRAGSFYCCLCARFEKKVQNLR